MKSKTKKFFTILITTILILSLNINIFAQDININQSDEPLHYMGALPDSASTKKNMEKYLLKEDVSTFASLPSSVDNSHLYPTPMKQTQNDCVAWATGYALVAGMQALNRGWTINTDAHKFSPAFLYNLTNNGVDEGVVLGDAISNVYYYGVSPITYYSISNPYNASIPSLAMEAASLYKPSKFYITTTLTQMKEAIAEGKGIVMGLWVYDEMYYNMSETNYIYDDVSGTCHGGHAVCVVGYDDSKQAFKFINSWGDDWCQDGYGWVSYDLVGNDNYSLYGAYYGFVPNFTGTDNYVMGDANLDNTITAADGRLALRFSSGIETPTDRQYVLSDVDGDGTVTSTDANNILNYAAGVINKLPIYE